MCGQEDSGAFYSIVDRFQIAEHIHDELCLFSPTDSAAIQIFQGMLLFFLLASDFLARYRLRFDSGGNAADLRKEAPAE